jgi:hypothetical protein
MLRGEILLDERIFSTSNGALLYPSLSHIKQNYFFFLWLQSQAT